MATTEARLSGDGNAEQVKSALLRDETSATMAGTSTEPSSSSSSSSHPPPNGDLRTMLGSSGLARRTLGICLLLLTVFLWTLSNFLASDIFADETYNKPFFLVYLNTSVFAISLIPDLLRYVKRSGVLSLWKEIASLWRDPVYSRPTPKSIVAEQEGLMDGEHTSNDDDDDFMMETNAEQDERLSFRETAKLSLEFCLLWFIANYLSSACLEYTSVASTTILTSTSGIWTLALGSMFGVETFTLRKLTGVMASIVGVVLISTVDLTGQSDENRGSFPHKSPAQIALGDAMALISAFVYGTYVTVMKRRVGSEDKVDMKLFFGMVGVFNLALLWPVFFILHWMDIEPFSLPPTGTVWAILIVNSLSSFVSDIAWAFAMLLTSPLVVTVGLSLTIPLSLVGEMVQYGQYSSMLYWIGAAVVILSFLFINHESQEETDGSKADEDGRQEIAAV
ncbi:hypothetical protein S40285_01662 [Stachybotrys chlorohalonatus IBT 40285]|uniref:DUF3955 domain-containing protein n=1 Tax=Stachybotrys chlorohalonatus (strain IBT 40285) TaxID=1283841 RepID=A0A084QE02_STAC4|nr:hypothetical protein S40285_01662 [Stachybotrys chlorohalonata IBT 40285]